MTTTKERILLLLNNKGVAVSSFFSSIGVSYSNFKGRQLESSPSADLVAKIKSNFPDVNTDWLLTGDGEMLLPNSSTNNSIEQKNDDFETRMLDFFARRDDEYKMILSQNSEIIRQNGELLKRVLHTYDKNE